MSVAMDSVQQRDIFAHIADASAAGATALGGQHTFNFMAMQDCLNRALAKPEDLPSSFGQQLLGVERQPHVAGMLSHHERNAQGSLATEFPVPSERLQRKSQVTCHSAAN